MEQEKVKCLIDMINNMDIKDKLRLAIRMSDSNYTNIKYDKPEMYEIFDNQLKDLDEGYRTAIINFNKYPTITFAMAKIIELTKEHQNQLALYLFNNLEK
ncbi:MAG TPA: hypothetical protein DDY53_02740 [Clostridiales bacterium]|nr:hypothetical protein [Clostridiales bacterium]